MHNPQSLKKRKHVKRDPLIVEPVRRTLLDVFEHNFKLAKRVIYIHRVIYVGEHTFDEPARIAELIKKNVVATNCSYNLEPMSGVLLYYERYFCHIIEGSEITLLSHLRRFLREYENNLKNAKLLIAVHHIHRRFLDDWLSYYGRPAVLIEQIDLNSDVETAHRRFKNCIQKLYSFTNRLVEDHQNALNQQDEGDEELEKTLDHNVSLSKTSLKVALTDKDRYMELLPELELLNFVINSKHLLGLKEYVNMWEYISPVDNYSDHLWPVPGDFISYTIFDKPREPVADLPKRGSQGVTKEEPQSEIA